MGPDSKGGRKNVLMLKVQQPIAVLDQLQRTLHERMGPDGGFCLQPGAAERADATAWAVQGLAQIKGRSQRVHGGRRWLAAAQLADGRIPLTAETPAAYWVTPLALLAWGNDQTYMEHRRRALDFLLQEGGATYMFRSRYMAHNPRLQGWAWGADTYSWVEPTSMALLALHGQGVKEHPRFQQGVALLLDRMLAEGGWNYGNREVFGRQLRPQPECTGMALCALRPTVDMQTVEKSLAYLTGIYPQLTTPLALAWALRGLCVYGRVPDDVDVSIARCLALQQRYGPFATALLGQLVLALTEWLRIDEGRDD